MQKRTHGIAWLALVAVLSPVRECAAAPGDKPGGDAAADPLPKGAVARLGTSRLRHTWGVRVLSFAANGKFLVSAGEETGGGGDAAVRVWAMPSGREVRTIPLGYNNCASQVAVSPDGATVVWVDAGGGVHGLGIPLMLQYYQTVNSTYDPSNWRTYEPIGPVPLAFSPDGKLFATGAYGGLVVVDVKTKKSVLSARVGAFHRCAFSPDGKTLAVADAKEGLRLIDVAAGGGTKPRTLKVPALCPGPVNFAFSPDGDQLVTGETRFVTIWDVAGGKEVRRIAWGDRTALAVAFSADGRQVTAVGDDGRAATWLTASGKEVRTFALPAHTLPAGRIYRIDLQYQDTADRLALSADGNWLAVAPQDVAVNLVNMTTGKKVAFADGQPGNHYTFAFAFTPDSKHLVTASEEDRLQIWDARLGKLVRTGKEDTDSVYWLGVTPDGKQVVSLSYSRAQRGTLRLEDWSLATARRLRQVDLGITPGLPALSPDGKWLAFGEPNDGRSRMHKMGDAVLVDRATGKQVRHFDAGDVSAPQDLTFSSDGKLLATINSAGTVRLWDVATGKLARSMNAEGSPGLSYRLRFTAADRTLVSTSMRYGPTGIASHIVEWAVATGQAQARHEGPKDIGWCQALSPDGKLFAWSGRPYRAVHETAEVWSVERQAPRQTLEGLRGGARFLGFSPDGRLLAGASYDRTVLVWRVAQE